MVNGQSDAESGMRRLTVALWPGVSVPLDGVKVAEDPPLATDQVRLLVASLLVLKATLQLKPLPSV